MSTTVIGSDPAREPLLGWRTVAAIAAATLASGPVLMFLFVLLNTVISPDSSAFNLANDPADVVLTLAKSVIRGPIVSLPATLVHLVAVGVLAHHKRDALGWSLVLGAVLGIGLAGLFIWVLVVSGEVRFGSWQSDLLFIAGIATPFAATGALMGLLSWRIAVRPLRRWRMLQQLRAAEPALRDEGAIRAME